MRARALGVLGHGFVQLAHLRQYLLRVARQGLPGGRGLRAAPLAHEQRRAQRIFQRPHARAGRGQRHVAAVGAGGDAALRHHVQEQAQVDQIHGRAVYWLCAAG